LNPLLVAVRVDELGELVVTLEFSQKAAKLVITTEHIGQPVRQQISATHSRTTNNRPQRHVHIRVSQAMLADEYFACAGQHPLQEFKALFLSRIEDGSSYDGEQGEQFHDFSDVGRKLL